MQLTDRMREETAERNRQLSDRTLEMISDPKETFVVPGAKSNVPYLNFAPLQNSLSRLGMSAREFDRSLNSASAGGRALAPEAQKTLDVILMRSERALTRGEGLPRRAWFKHQIYAPGFYTGYGVKTLPGVREAVEQREWAEATAQIETLARTLDNFTAEVERATAIVKDRATRR